MAKYVKNTTWADGSGGGTAITAAKLNNVESGIFDAHYQAAARVTHNTTQNVTNVTETALAFNTERFDTESNAASTIHDTASNNSRLTCRTAGKYQITANIQWDSNNTGVRQLSIRLNGTTFIARVGQASTGTALGWTNQSVSTLYDLAVNDYVEATVWQDSGGTRTIDFGSNWTPEFMMVCVG